MTATTLRLIAVALGLAYLIGYLFIAGDLSLARTGTWSGQIAPSWAELWLRPRGLFQFEAIAMLQGGRLLLLVSPLNLLIAGLMAALVALNVHGILALRRQPPQCRVGGSSSGMFAAIPALLAGGACCAPALLLLIGLPSLGAFAGLFGWLIPLSILLLVTSRWWQRHLGAPAFLARRHTTPPGTTARSGGVSTP